MQPCILDQSTASSGASTTAPTQIEITAFRSALDHFDQDRCSDEQAVVDVLLDFFASRCLVAGEMRDLGGTLHKALNATTTQAVTLSSSEERVEFHRSDRRLSVFIDGRRLATITVRDASRLVELLGASNDRAMELYPLL